MGTEIAQGAAITPCARTDAGQFLYAAYLELDAAWSSLETAGAHLDYAYRNAPLLLLDVRHAQAVRCVNQAREAFATLRAYIHADETRREGSQP